MTPYLPITVTSTIMQTILGIIPTMIMKIMIMVIMVIINAENNSLMMMVILTIMTRIAVKSQALLEVVLLSVKKQKGKEKMQIVMKRMTISIIVIAITTK